MLVVFQYFTRRHLFVALICWLATLAPGLSARAGENEFRVVTPDGPDNIDTEKRLRDAMPAPWRSPTVEGLHNMGTVNPARTTRRSEPNHALAGADGDWLQVLPSGRYLQTAIYDPVRDRIVVFGGYDGAYHNDVWALSLSATPMWELLRPMGTPPAARSDNTAIYDPLRNRMVVFGGSSPTRLNDVWELSLSGNPTWNELTPAGTPPSGRAQATAMYDPARDRMVVFGGVGGSEFYNDVWELSLSNDPAWEELSPVGTLPPGRYGHAAVYDPTGDSMVLLAGYGPLAGGGYGFLDDTWALSLSGGVAWTEIAATGDVPSARFGHTAVYDSLNDRIVIFGGYIGANTVLNDAWALSLSGSPAWTELVTGSRPPARYGHTSIFDPVRDRMVIFGGFDSNGDDFYYNDVWQLSLLQSSAWTELTPTGIPPKVSYAHRAIYDPVGDRMIVSGGVYLDAASGQPLYSSLSNDTWALSLYDRAKWTLLSPTGMPPSARYGHTAVYDPVRARVVVFGGYDGSWSNLRNDTQTLSLSGSPEWAELTPPEPLPVGRYGHTAVFDPVRDRMVVLGGYDGSSVRNDLWSLTLSGTPTWTELNVAGSLPTGRLFHTAVYDPLRDRVVVFGGMSSSNFLGDVWILSLSGSPTWSELILSNAPPARLAHTAILDPLRDRMVVFGGNADPVYGDTWALSMSGSGPWIELTTGESPPSGRYFHTAVYDPVRDRMIVHAGAAENSMRNDTWALQWDGGLPIPVLISRFDATPRRDGVELTWELSSDEALESFSLYRGRDESLPMKIAAGDARTTRSYTDASAEPGATYRYELVIRTVSGGEFRAPVVTATMPSAVTTLTQNFPNPFNPSTTIEYAVSVRAPVAIEIFDASGALVRRLDQGVRQAGSYSAEWDGRDAASRPVASGVYFYRLSGVKSTEVRKMLLLK